jgi:PAS domain S-box-containing protein
LLENSWLGIITVDRDSRIVHANRAAEELLEEPPGSLDGKRIMSLRLTLRAVLMSHYERVLREGVPEKIEKLVRPDKHLRFNMYPDERGVIITVEDISREWILDEAKRLALLTINSLPDAVFMIRQTGHIINVNDQACSCTGYSKQELQGMTIREVMPGLDIGQSRAMAGDGPNREMRWVKELELLQRDGGTVPVEVSVSEKKIYGIRQYLVIARDITVRKRAEEALRESVEKYRSVYEQSAVGIARVSPDYRFIDVNQKFCDITGYTAMELSDKTFMDITYQEDVDSDVEQAGQLLAGRIKTYSMEKRYIRKDGSLVWINLTVSLVRKPDGTPHNFVSIIEDISQRKRAQEELAEERQRAELYLDLMGHDINNQMQIGIGFLELSLERAEKCPGEAEFVENALDSLRNSTRLIENVRKLQKVEAHELRHHPIDVCQLLSDVRSGFLKVPGREVSINLTRYCDCVVNANELLKDVFTNLVGNAIKHSEGPLTIEIKVWDTYEDGQMHCNVTIEDNGPGINPELKSKLFTRFQRGATKAHGKGLGLYLVKALVEDFNGKIWVEDRVPGDYKKGSKFVIRLPTVEK